MLDWRLCFVTNRSHHPDRQLTGVVRAACAAGLRAVQLREHNLTTRELFDQAAVLREITREAGADLLINDRLDIVLAVDADGLHAPERDATTLVPLAPRFMGGAIGVSCHSLLAAAEAETAGADYVTFGPIYPTPSKQRFGAPQGLDKLARVADTVDIPVVAVGGITPQRARECRSAGASAVAVISAIADAPDIGARIGEFREAMGEL